MLPSLLTAQADAAPAAPLLPASFEGLPLVVIGTVVCTGLVAGVILAGFARLRSALAEEMRREIESTAKALQVQVQSPLVVTAEQKFAEATELQALKEDVESLARVVQDGFDKLNGERRTSVANLHAKVDAVANSNATLAGEVRLLNQQVQQLVTTLLNRSPGK